MTEFDRTITTRDMYRELRSMVLEREPHAPIASSREIAREFGVSASSANKVLGRLVSEGLLYREHGSGTFVAPRTGSGGLTVGLGFIEPDGYDPASIASIGVYRDAGAAHVRALGHVPRYVTYADLCEPEVAAGILRELDGLVMTSGFLDADTRPVLDAWAKPLVLLQPSRIAPHPFHQVAPDLYGGYIQAFMHLRESGHDKFVIACDDSRTSCERRQSMLEAAVDTGLGPEAFSMLVLERDPGDTGRLLGRKLGHEYLLRGMDLPIVMTSDFFAFGMIDVFLDAGLAVGRDVVLVSYDNIEGEGYSPYPGPMLTSIASSKKQLAREAVDLLLQCIGCAPTATCLRRVPAKLVVRESSGGRRGRKRKNRKAKAGDNIPGRIVPAGCQQPAAVQ